MPDIIMKREHTDRWTKMRLSRARSSGTAASCHTPSSVGCITTMSESEFSVHTASQALLARSLHLAHRRRLSTPWASRQAQHREQPAIAALGADTQTAPTPNPAARTTKRAKILTRDMALLLDSASIIAPRRAIAKYVNRNRLVCDLVHTLIE